jgi:uncharacterized protein YjbJ (UPF0337 family)
MGSGVFTLCRSFMQARWSNFFLHRWQTEIMRETRRLIKRSEGKVIHFVRDKLRAEQKSNPSPFHVRNERKNTMKSSTKDQAEGTFHQIKGKIKEVAGELSDNPKLEAEGTGEKIAGKVQEKIGQVKKVLGN